MDSTYQWRFPLPRTHTGMLQGNGRMGVMVWGGDGVLRITVGMADFWDHRGGMPWTEKMSYTKIRECLEREDEQRLRELFETTVGGEGVPRRPSVLPIGRIELDFGPKAVLDVGELNLADGSITVSLIREGGRQQLRLLLDMERPVLLIALPKALKPDEVRRVTSWDYVGEHLESISFTPPRMLDEDAVRGWVQERPVDPALCLAWREEPTLIALTCAYGEDADHARREATKQLDTAVGEGADVLRERTRRWWSEYWSKVPSVDVPNERLQFLYEYGMYKFAGLTNPSGVPATLQGPWIEEYQMPPWSSDYHFNINVQMCYWPAYHGNRPEHLRPLFDLIMSWQDTLRHNAKVFLGIDDGLMLPHAVDDRCVCMGGFWTGSVDHGCTAWVAQMMFRYYLYTLDEEFLRETAWPFMKGAMRVYEEMLEREGDEFVLPVSVSPEYRGSRMDAWGRNASFQLACIHRLCEDLLEAAHILQEQVKPVWSEILQKLPKACLIGPEGQEKIALWQGTPLEESHRHHSHLAGITPFDVFDRDDAASEKILLNSMNDLVYHGMGLWSGWCVPWAAMLHMRMGNGDGAQVLLEMWQRVFTNEGHGTLHDVDFPGISLMGRSYSLGASRSRKEIMQMDAGMSCTAAIQEMFVHTRRGVNYVFAGCPRDWKECRFTGMLTEGGFLLDGERVDGRVRVIRINSPHGGTIRIANPWEGAACVIRRGEQTGTAEGEVLITETENGETVELVEARHNG